jgi:hypothetical protein
MPTLFRFFMTLVVLAGLAAAAMFYLANFVEPRTREMTIRIPSSRLAPRPIGPMPSPSPPAAAENEAGGEAGEAAVR